MGSIERMHAGVLKLIDKLVTAVWLAGLTCSQTQSKVTGSSSG